MPVTWVEHRAHNILYVDYRNLGPTECLATLREHAAAIAAAPEPVLTLVDARGARFDSQFMDAAKALGPQNSTRTRKRAIVGAEGLKGLLLGFFNVVATPVPMMPFATMDEALAYLTEP
jgi:hypothetical protein